MAHRIMASGPKALRLLDEVQPKVTDTDRSRPKKKARYSEDMIRDCLAVIDSGDIEDLFQILPRIGVLRDARFKKPLLALLAHKDVRRREFAAYAIGALRDKSALEPLKKAFAEARQLKGSGSRELQVAIIESIGTIGDDAAVDFFLSALRSCGGRKQPAGRKGAGGNAGRLSQWIIESLGAIAQQGGKRSLKALVELLDHDDAEIRALAISSLSGSYWHRPNEVADGTIQKIYRLTSARETVVAESALEALQNLADVGCRRAEEFFEEPDRSVE